MKRFPLGLPLIALLILTSLGGAMPDVARAKQDRDDRVRTVLQAAEVTGMSWAVLEGGRVASLGTYGVRSAATSPSVDTVSVFEAASLTKPVVALVALQLVDEGLLNLDRPLVDYAAYPDLAHASRTPEVTARMILSHTSGLPNWRQPEGRLDFSGVPGERFSYSGEGFVFLQRVIESIEKRPLHAVVQDRVLTPLGMTRSSLIWEDRFGSSIAVGHLVDGTPLDKFTPQEANAAYSLHTTAADYARFLAAVLDGAGLSEATFADMLAMQADAGEGISWGLGWGLETTSKGKAIWHWGDNRGYKAFVAGYPGQGRGFVFFSNSDNGMLALHRLTELLDGVEHPAVTWLNYERYDDVSFQVGRDLRKAMEDSTSAPLRTVLAQLKRTYPASAFDEYTLNDLGYRLLRAGRYQEAIRIFELNVTEYPQEANPYDSLGEAYMLSGDPEKALLNYRVSLDLDPGNDTARAMIVRLEAQIKAQGAGN